MTERLYYEDSYLLDFTAEVTECRTDRTGTWIALNRSAFYPTSGGQPYDTGIISWVNETGKEEETKVSDVTVDGNGIVWHLTGTGIAAGTEIRGRIDGERRMDHMEQHGGEHMLAGAVWEKLGGTTLGLHLGTESSTIDVEMPDGRTHLTPEETDDLETMVNARIRLDAPIRCWFPDQEELERLPLRKPPTVREHVRVVAMGDFEMVACGGTHPCSTGRIGLLKILSAAPSRGKVRITFVCGKRAENVFRSYMKSMHKAGNVLSCPPEKVASCAGELKARLADAERRLNRFETERILATIRSQEERESLPGISISVTLMEGSDERPAMEAVSRYIAEDGKILLLSAGERLIFARSGDIEVDMNTLIKRVARGGGRPELSSGAGIPQCAEVAKKILVTEGKGQKWRRKN